MLRPLFFSGPALSCRAGQPGPLPHAEKRGCKPTLRQAYSRPGPRVQFAFKDSMIHIICNSHYVSHFAAFFIDTGAKISVVESCLRFLMGHCWRHRWLQALVCLDRLGDGPAERLGLPARLTLLGTLP